MEESKLIRKFKHVEVRKIPTFYRTVTKNGFRDFESKNEAVKWAKEFNEEKEKEKCARESKDLFEIKQALFIKEQLGKYIKKLEEELWHYRKYEGISKEEAEGIDKIRKILKKIISELYDIYSGKIEVVWHQNYFSNSTFYTIEKIDEDRIKNFSYYNKIIEYYEKENDKPS